MHKLLIKGSLFSLFILWASIAQAKNIVVEASGFGQSRDSAILQMKRSAVEQAMGVFIDSRTVTSNFALESERILTHSEGFVRRILDLSENRENGLWHVKSKVVVTLDSIKNEMVATKMLLADSEMPRIMVLMKEVIDNNPITSNQASETEFINILTKKRFLLVDLNQVHKIRNTAIAKQALQGNIEASVRLGLQFGADFIITGSALSQSRSISLFSKSRMLTNQATLNVKIINASSGVVITAVSKQRAEPHISPLTGGMKAIRKISKEALDGYLLDKIMLSMMDEINNGKLIKIHMTGLTSFSLFNLSKKLLGNSENVVSITKRMWNKKSGLAEFDIIYKGKTDDLAEKIDGMKIREESAIIEVNDLTVNTIDIHLTNNN